MTMTEITREFLLAICERAFVPESGWRSRNSAEAQQQLGRCYALLKDGCAFKVRREETDGCNSTDRTLWVEVTFRGFGHFDYGGGLDSETFYLPTEQRLEAEVGKDWY